jgi:hypothetical protein
VSSEEYKSHVCKRNAWGICAECEASVDALLVRAALNAPRHKLIREEHHIQAIAERDTALAKVAELEAARWPDAGDRPIPEDAAIKAAHPLRTGRHDIYAEAMRMVGAKHSKGALVELVNWLLWRVEAGR